MTRTRHLDKAPITEAIIDFRAQLPDTFRVQEFEPLQDVLVEAYPITEKQKLYEGGFRLSGEQLSQTTQDKGVHGFIFKNEEQGRVAQFRRNGFTFNKLKPYTDWKDVFAEAWRLWLEYAAIAKPLTVTRVAVRYVNRITVPRTFAFPEYFTDPPTLPDDLPQTFSDYFKRVVINDAERGLLVNVIQAIERQQDSDTVVFLLDIDAYAQEEHEPGSSELEPRFQQLRVLKNQVFFGCITDKTAEMFE
ncbi:TIGR04255 family protein [Candidatus Eisenbacteria bacterium]|uniref:TIGR04255 family protein n=1 Tax=Eiseniibacteriota bacterium TaxID=2212470 RepID=A0ABV6YLP7_UNCEI